MLVLSTGIEDTLFFFRRKDAKNNANREETFFKSVFTTCSR